MVNIAVLGHGVVGSGVVEVIDKNYAHIEKNLGQGINIKRILDLREFDVPYKDKFTKNFDDILNDDEISVVVEVMGGINPAYDFTKKALNRKKSVVTSNKELVAAKGAELLKVAKQNNVNFYFEASVGGGIPIIRPMHSCLAANVIDEVAGILNGTTNYILTKMINEHMSFDAALKLAQHLGYAERNPSADVDGHDACRKICILASLAYGKHIYPENVYTQGICDISLEDVEYANNFGCVIKLIGRAKKLSDESEDILCMVSPAFISKQSQLGVIEDVFNGIMVRGNATGDVVFYGKGAGKLPTASAVVGDVIAAAKRFKTTESLTWEDDGINHVVDYKTTSVPFYVRCAGKDVNKVVEGIFSDIEFLSRKDKPDNETAFITTELAEYDLDNKLDELKQSGIEVINYIRVLDY